MELNLNTVQKLLISQRMVLSAKILQMNSIELNEYLKELAETNPLVEYEEQQLKDNKIDTFRKKLEWLDSCDEQNRYYYKDDKEDSSESWNFSLSESETLEEHILTQINTQQLPKEVHQAAEFVTKSLDENGYLKDSADSISSLTGIDIKYVKDAISFIKTLDPPGVGAVDLSECLEIQLLSEEPVDTIALLIVKNHLDLLAKNHIKLIAKSVGTSIDKTIDSCAKIKLLNPKPSRGFSSNESLSYITPDAYIYKDRSGNYNINLNNSYVPSLKINSYYKKIIKSDDNADAKEYISDKLHQAEWVMKCIDKRNSTLMSTLELIVKKQYNFFDKGIGNLIPMKLLDISETLKVHESTVSRAIRDKYIQCSWGIFPLDYFFTNAIVKKTVTESGNNNEISQNSVKLRIKDIINNENKKKPLSDQKITEILENEDIKISRRTVTKYRESINIPSASMRKQY